MEVLKITKLNEVYLHVDCSANIAKELTEHFKFKAPGFQFMPAYRRKHWSGDIFLFNPKNNTIYCGLIEYIEQLCFERNYTIEYLYDNLSNEFSLHQATQFISSLNLNLEVRDYQIDAFTHCIRSNRKTVLLPTGSGKSLVIYLLYRFYNLKTLIIVPTTSLIHQLSSDFKNYGLIDNIHKVYSGQSKDSEERLTISTWQSLINVNRKWLNEYSLVIIDEAHLAQASSITGIMNKLVNCKYRFGFTGTLSDSKTHKLVIEGLFGSVRKSVTTSELIEKKHLASFKIKNIVLTYSNEIRKLVSNMDYQGEIDYIVRLSERNTFITNLALSLKGNTLLLFQYVEKHGKVLYDTLISENPNRKIYFVSGEVEGIERENIRNTVENEDNSIIVASSGVFSTGINIKNIHNIIFASPSKSKIRNLQSIGRGLRRSETKSSSVLYDISDDMTWNNSKNFTLNHFIERIRIYNEEKFEYKIYRVSLNTT